MQNINRSDYQDVAERILRWWIVKGEQPSTVMTGGSTYTKPEYIDAILRVQKFIDTNKKMPEHVRFGNIAPGTDGNCYWNSKYDIFKQKEGYCGPSAAHIALQDIGINIPVDDIAVYEHTVVPSGTNPSDLDSGIVSVCKKNGYNVKVYSKSYHDVGLKTLGELLADPKKTVILHVLYKNHPGWGHYECPVKVCLREKTISVVETLHNAVEIHLEAEIIAWMNGISFNSVHIVERI
jgi:hypothetical protein